MIFKFIIIYFCFVSASFCIENYDINDKESVERVTKNVQDKFSNEYMNYIKTGEKSSILKDLMKQLTFPMETGVPEIDRLVQPRDAEICMQCRALVEVVLDLRRSGLPDELLKSTVIEVCWTMEIQLPHVCEGFVNLNFDAVAYIIDNNPDLSADQACGIIRQAANCDIQNPLPDWSINIDQNGPSAGNGPKMDTPTPSENDITVLQLTDIHFDPNYLENSNAVCLQPACCRRAQGIADFPEYGAGRWGDYRDCDSPWETLEDMFFQIRETHRNIDYIYLTGDIIDHGVWETSFAVNVQGIMRTMVFLKQMFPNIPVFPILGNHEAHPVNLMAPEYLSTINHPLSTQWLYDLSAEEWNFWLPDDTKETILKGGYYTVLVRPGFRVIALNNNDCFIFNLWLMLTSEQSIPQLQWLHDTLLMAESNNEKVHILKHIPTGNGECLAIWDREFNRIVQRFWNTISGQFNGHTHHDEFTVYYSSVEPSNAINVAWNGGSGTSFSNVNSNYRLYSVETNSYQITDHETWIFNLTAANLNRNQRPEWFKEYSFLNAYNLNNLSPNALDDLLVDFANKPEKLHLFWQHGVKMGDPMLALGCDNYCLANELCVIATSVFGQTARCDQLLEIFWNNVKK